MSCLIQMHTLKTLFGIKTLTFARFTESPRQARQEKSWFTSVTAAVHSEVIFLSDGSEVRIDSRVKLKT